MSESPVQPQAKGPLLLTMARRVLTHPPARSRTSRQIPDILGAIPGVISEPLSPQIPRTLYSPGPTHACPDCQSQPASPEGRRFARSVVSPTALLLLLAPPPAPRLVRTRQPCRAMFLAEAGRAHFHPFQSARGIYRYMCPRHWHHFTFIRHHGLDWQANHPLTSYRFTESANQLPVELQCLLIS
jgi:hypothetical protein